MGRGLLGKGRRDLGQLSPTGGIEEGDGLDAAHFERQAAGECVEWNCCEQSVLTKLAQTSVGDV